MAFKAVSQSTTSGRPPSFTNQKLYQELKSFYDKEFKDLLDPSFIDISSKNLSYILGYEITSILIGFENNIKEHFYSHLVGFVLKVFKQQNEQELLLSDIRIIQKWYYDHEDGFYWFNICLVIPEENRIYKSKNKHL